MGRIEGIVILKQARLCCFLASTKRSNYLLTVLDIEKSVQKQSALLFVYYAICFQKVSTHERFRGIEISQSFSTLASKTPIKGLSVGWGSV